MPPTAQSHLSVYLSLRLGLATGTPVLKDVGEARARAYICALYEPLGRLASEKCRGREDRRRGSHGCEDGAHEQGILSNRQI